MLGRGERIARVLMLHPDAWSWLSADDLHLLAQQPPPAGDLLAWLERYWHEHGPTPWTDLQPALAGEPFAPLAQRLVRQRDQLSLSDDAPEAQTDHPDDARRELHETLLRMRIDALKAQETEALKRADADPQAAVLAPQLTNAQGRPDVNYRWSHLRWTSRGPAADGPACVGFVCGAAMLCRLSAFEGVGFFDERFFLYYEDDDLCLRLFQARRPMVVVPSVTAVHRSRGSVRGNSPWRSEYLRGYHHAQSKLIFTAKHQTVALAQRQRRRLVGTTLLGLPLRLLLISPRLAARMIGRLRGALDWTLPHG